MIVVLTMMQDKGTRSDNDEISEDIDSDTSRCEAEAVEDINDSPPPPPQQHFL